MSMFEIMEDVFDGVLMGITGAVVCASAPIFVPASGLAGLLGAGTTVSALPTTAVLLKGAVVGVGMKYAYNKYGKPYLISKYAPTQQQLPATPATPALTSTTAIEELNVLKQIVYDLQQDKIAAAAAAAEAAKAAAAKTNMRLMLTGLNYAQVDIDRILAAMP